MMARVRHGTLLFADMDPVRAPRKPPADAVRGRIVALFLARSGCVWRGRDVRFRLPPACFGPTLGACIDKGRARSTCPTSRLLPAPPSLRMGAFGAWCAT